MAQTTCTTAEGYLQWAIKEPISFSAYANRLNLTLLAVVTNAKSDKTKQIQPLLTKSLKQLVFSSDFKLFWQCITNSQYSPILNYHLTHQMLMRISKAFMIESTDYLQQNKPAIQLTPDF